MRNKGVLDVGTHSSAFNEAAGYAASLRGPPGPQIKVGNIAISYVPLNRMLQVAACSDKDLYHMDLAPFIDWCCFIW